ncbi:unnamed protein product [Amaranthus hypochondriacus]
MFEYAVLFLSLIVLGISLGFNCVSLLGRIWSMREPINDILDFMLKLPHWLNYYNNLKDDTNTLDMKTTRLTRKAHDIRSEASAAEHQTLRQVKAEVRNWLENVQTVDNQVQEILEQAGRDMNIFVDFFYRAWLGIVHVDKKLQQVEQLLDTGSSLQTAPLISKVRPELPYLTSKLIGSEAVGNIKKVLEFLKSDRVSCICVHGAQGTGKTEIVKHIYNRLLVNTNVYYVQIKENITNHELSSKIARTLGLELVDEDESRRPDFLYRALRRKGKFVLIIDGLIRDFRLVEVGIPVHPNGGKLIFTTRSPNVSRRMDSQVIIELQPLSDDEADELFRQEVQMSEYDSEEMEGVARRMLQQCGNVPGTIIGIADMLKREHDIHVWWNTLNELQQHL